MNRILLTVILVLQGLALSAREPLVSRLEGLAIVPADTTYLGEDLDEDEDTVARTRVNYATGYNAMDYVMEGRYLPDGETFVKRKRWYRNLFVQGGVGMEKMTQPTDDYEISPLMYAQLGVGKDLGKLHALRLTLHGAWGNQRNKDLTLSKYGAKLEHMYNLSSYFSGYNPTRLFGLSTIFGLGGQYSKKANETGMSLEGHVGAQLRFYTGPKAYISIEPYVGIGGDQMDLSGNRNWRKKDIFYGANVNFVYYLDNNLSPESRLRIIKQRNRRNQLSTDSLLENWQQPWFIQFANGVSMMNSPRLPMSQTMGTELMLSGGKWLSPVIGLRGSLFSRTNTWKKNESEPDASTYHPAYSINQNNVYIGARLEAMVNPLGFLRGFHWDNAYGFYLVGAAEIGWLLKTQSQPLNCSSTGWGGGINLWYRLAPGLKVFVEPRYMHNEYKIPYTNVDWYKQYADNNLSVNLGLTVEMRDDERFYEHNYEYEYVTDRLQKIVVGLGGGTHLLQTERSVSSGSGLGYNGLLFGEYHFDRLKAVRLGAEFVSMKQAGLTPFIDYNMEYPEADYAPVNRVGLWEHKYMFLLISPSGMVDLNYLALHYQPQRFRLYAFAGPTVAYVLKYDRQLSPLERIMQNHRVDPVGAEKVGFSFGAHLGFKLDCRITRHIGAFFSPTVYMMGNTKMPGVEFTKLKLFETFNLGAQYSF